MLSMCKNLLVGWNVMDFKWSNLDFIFVVLRMLLRIFRRDLVLVWVMVV